MRGQYKDLFSFIADVAQERGVPISVDTIKKQISITSPFGKKRSYQLHATPTSDGMYVEEYSCAYTGMFSSAFMETFPLTRDEGYKPNKQVALKILAGAFEDAVRAHVLSALYPNRRKIEVNVVLNEAWNYKEGFKISLECQPLKGYQIRNSTEVPTLGWPDTKLVKETAKAGLASMTDFEDRISTLHAYTSSLLDKSQLDYEEGRYPEEIVVGSLVLSAVNGKELTISTNVGRGETLNLEHTATVIALTQKCTIEQIRKTKPNADNHRTAKMNTEIELM